MLRLTGQSGSHTGTHLVSKSALPYLPALLHQTPPQSTMLDGSKEIPCQKQKAGRGKR